MLVETFEADTTDTLTLEERTECEQILDSLSLLQQKAFVGESTVNPFRLMSKEEQRVYGCLLSNRDSVEDFDASAIPLRVLKTIQLCLQNRWFEKLMIWHDSAERDPLLVGYLDRTWNAQPFLLARWGDELENFDALRKRAIDRYTVSLRCERQKALDSVATDAVAFMHGNGF